jgi:hypothetical protein
MPSQKNSSGRLRVRLIAGAAIAAVVPLGVVASGALGASVTSASFSGGAGTVPVGGTLYAKQGGALTLTVNTSDDVECVELTGAHTGRQTSPPGKTAWSFSLTAGAGDGVKAVTVTASKNFNQSQSRCQGSQGTRQASYVLDNTGPQVSGAVSPAANVAGWHNAEVGVTWSATDAGSGVASGPTPASDSVTAETASVVRTASATDRLDNAGSGSVAVKLDKTAPTIGASRSPQPNANGWNNSDVTVSLDCSDALSGIKGCTGQGTKVLSGEGAEHSLTATAVDNADNTASAMVGPVRIDKTAPTLHGDVSGNVGDDGWYTSDVDIHWTCDDALSGIDGDCPADSRISGEGQRLKATASVSDAAGNVRTADSPTVRIDATPPNTDASAVNAWNNVDATVRLTAGDALSGVAATHYRVDGGAAQNGTEVSIADEGKHMLEYWSVDRAGNVEGHKTVEVGIDKTSPTIRHEFAPGANANGWFNADVEVHFVCGDELSGIDSCGPDRVVSTEGIDQDASGEAVDRAGNHATDPAKVSLDKTAPSVRARADREPNAYGWYNADVTVSFSCDDALSGVDHCPAAQILGEGEDQSAGATASDAAGNTAGDGVNDIDVDKTAPSLTGAPTTEPNANGWYRDDVTVAWTCADALSGLHGDCPAPAVVGGEGENLSAAASVRDKAGNEAQATVAGLHIDRTPPTTTAELPIPLQSGWYAGPIEVALRAADSLSGVERIYYRVDDGEVRTYSGTFELAEKGVRTIAFWSVDVAGNVEDRTAPGHAVTVKIDGVPPRIAGRRTPAANAFGWSNEPVTVTFECSDDESGIAGCSDPVTLSDEGAAQSVPGSAQDNAGNTSSTTVEDINIDRTAPELVGAPTSDPNAAGWYRDDVTVKWTGSDGLSGIDPATAPGDSVIGGEGADLAAGPATIADKGGNTTSASVTRIKIDRTAPVISGAPTTPANDAGWHGRDVVVAFSCTDNLSGVASCPSDKLVSGNGAGQSVTSDPATDVAGNQSAGKTVAGLNIDGLPPQTTADNRCTKTNGYCTGSTATVVLSAADQEGLSGVKEIRYRVDGAAEQVADGASASVTVPLDGSGEATVTFFAVDRAGNREAESGVALKYDTIAPTVTHTLAPAPNGNQWNHSDVTVHFDARDDDRGSGVDAARTTPDVVVDHETAGHVVDGEAFDIAGNRGADSVSVKLDKTQPSIVGATVNGTRGADGWYVGPVRVSFSCADGLSGIAICPDDVILTANGKGQSVAREAVDFAGNTATAVVGGIDIDAEQPAISLSGIADGAVYTLGAVPAASCTARDDVSGAAGCDVAVSGGEANGVGTFTYRAMATDRAGNTRTESGSYRVVYRFDGFLQPINDTAHQVGATTSVFKAGSTVPVKFQLKRADGSVVPAGRLPVWETPAEGGPTTAPVDESGYPVASDSAANYRWDGQKYQYNWSTSRAAEGHYHRIGVRLDDGQTYFVNIGLR